MKYAAGNPASLCSCVFPTLSDKAGLGRPEQMLTSKQFSQSQGAHCGSIWDADSLQHNSLEKIKGCVGPKNMTSEATGCEATTLTKTTAMEKPTELHRSAYCQKS